MKAVINSTPLIALAITNNLDLLSILFDQVFVPDSVYCEVTKQGLRPGAKEVSQIDWFTIKSPKFSPIPPEILKLDQGEKDVILLALETKADWIILDENLGRKIALNLGCQIKGTLGILLIAYKTNLISKEDTIKAINILSQSSIRLSSNLLEWFLKQL